MGNFTRFCAFFRRWWWYARFGCWRFCCCWLFCCSWRFSVACVSAFDCVSSCCLWQCFSGVTNVANTLPFSGYPMMLLSVMSLLLPMFSLPLASAVADLPAVAVVGILLLLAFCCCWRSCWCYWPWCCCYRPCCCRYSHSEIAGLVQQSGVLEISPIVIIVQVVGLSPLREGGWQLLV